MNQRKLEITMFSSADKVAGQGVGSAYLEQVNLLKSQASELFDIKINDWFAKADIKHFHTIDPAFLVPMLDKKAVKVAYCHFLPDTVIDGSLKIPSAFQPLTSHYIIHFYNMADHLVVVNPSFIPDLVRYGIPREKITYIPNYVSKEKFHSLGQAKKEETRQKYNIPEDAFIALGVGQVQTRKGVLDFCEVAKLCPEITFVWAGGFSFGAMTDGYEKLKALMENPPANVRFIGIIDRSEMVSIYNMADVLFVPSYNELFPMTILEASNLGIPLLLRDLDLYRDILFGHYLMAQNNEQFAKDLMALKNDPELYQKYQKESEAISAYYSKEHVVEMWKSFYLDVYHQKQRELGNE
ncbi:glycosyltransferase family 4 protein [Dubosiella newyorkensis]|uniref:glycosyltransferase family 4 protein n=2 Tax=Dubosiella newyorkensis TaxID=1862672 RepID=UPI00272CF38F|nr:glycosyltransferase family 4 protein [Dubosiella newyorkensis]